MNHAKTIFSRCVMFAIASMLAACAGVKPGVRSGPGPGELAMPSIDVPTVKARELPKADIRALPDGARASLVNRDASPIFVTIPPRRAEVVSARDVLEQVVEPILKAVKFERGAGVLRVPPDKGIAQIRPNLAAMARLLEHEYQGNERQTRQRTHDMIDAFLGKKPPTPDVEQNLRIARGMTFAQFKADIEREQIIYPFLQVHGDVPIEHTMLLATRWEGQSVTTVHGNLIHQYSIANRKPGNDRDAVERGFQALAKVKGIDAIRSKKTLDGPWLVLLAYGNDASGNIALHYAYRMTIEGVVHGRVVPFRAWVDAETWQILKLRPLVMDVGAGGQVWRRDPGTGATRSINFDVDAASAGQYVLKLANVANRVDYQNNGFDANDVSISDSASGSSSTFANFNQSPINDSANAVCSAGGNVRFQQVHYFGLFHLNWSQANAHGIFTPFPTGPWSPRLESATAGCNAWSDMDFGACQGYYDAACPNYSSGGTSGDNYMNFAHDSTVVGHELAHNSVQRFTDGRPPDWCGAVPCSIPLGWGTFHDLADAWADHFDNTNCVAGWVAKNLGGVDASNNCQGSRGHREDGGLPRLHEVTWPFNPASPGDHYPEHRSAATGDYAEMQIPSAALWQVREGMRSKCRPSGQPQYFVRFTRALKETGLFSAVSPGTTDLGIYEYLRDLEVKMIDQWATSGLAGGPPAFAHNGNHTTNKVLAGFAKAGLFPIPSACIDGSAATVDAGFCPAGENGAEAVIDIDDNDAGDDLVVDGITHPETDFLRLGGPAPTFQVWTGSRFTFSGSSARPLTATAPCNSKFIVEVATDAAFPAASTVSSGWITVDTNNTTAASPECYGTWTPSGAEWTSLQSGGALTRLYYRARTRNAADANERVSTSPGAGLWTVPPPYAVITATGGSDY